MDSSIVELLLVAVVVRVWEQTGNAFVVRGRCRGHDTESQEQIQGVRSDG